ncbi:SMP-30/gluconolactonase/LRE family protein [soil metagenome]
MNIMIFKQKILGIVLLTAICSCQSSKEVKTTGSIERVDPTLESIVSPDATIEIIADGFDWTEGPLWIEDKKMLLFSDIPKNTVFKWTEENGIETYLKPSGYTGVADGRGEPGSNGLLLDGQGNLVLCQHGDRRLARMASPLDTPRAEFVTIAATFDGKKINSPNDATFHDGDFYFTDPPYGLAKGEADSLKETPFQGVYRVQANGQVTMLIDSLTRPNGIAFSPDGSYLYVANSDKAKARWYRYSVVKDDMGNVVLAAGKILYDATSLTATEKGLPDGMKVDNNGTIFASGPGGIFIFNPEGKVLGKIKLAEAASNTALSGDQKILYITNDMNILRVKLRK